MRQFKISSDGAMVHTQSPLLEGWEKCEDLKTLLGFATPRSDMPEADMNWLGSKLPAALMQQMLGTIRQFPTMEVAFSLYYSVAEGKWAVKCPQQNGSGASVHFQDDGDGMPAGYSIIGSVHTHPNMSAFWSSTDMGDQKKKHGVHLVLGLRNGYADQYKLSIFTPNGYYDKDWNTIIEEVDFNQDWAPVEEWVAEIKAQRLPRPVYVSANTVGTAAYTTNSRPARKHDRYYGGWHTSWPYGAYDEYDNVPVYRGGYHYSSTPITVSETRVTATGDTRETNEKLALLRRTINELRESGEYAALTQVFLDCMWTPIRSLGAALKEQKELGYGLQKTVTAYSDDLLERLEDILWSVNELATFDPELDRGVIQVLEGYGWVVDDDAAFVPKDPVLDEQEAVTC